jgi:hypothetical protein
VFSPPRQQKNFQEEDQKKKPHLPPECKKKFRGPPT